MSGYLTPQAKTRLLEIIDRRGFGNGKGSFHIGKVMGELRPPFSHLDPSLGFALLHGRRLRPDMIRALESWMIDNRHV